MVNATAAAHSSNVAAAIRRIFGSDIAMSDLTSAERRLVLGAVYPPPALRATGRVHVIDGFAIAEWA